MSMEVTVSISSSRKNYRVESTKQSQTPSQTPKVPKKQQRRILFPQIKPKSYHKKKAHVKPKTPLQRAFQGRERQHYFTFGTKVTAENARDFFKESSPFQYPNDLEEFSFKVLSKAWREKQRSKEITLSVRDKPSERSRQRLDLLERLYVEEPQLKDMKTIFDIDPDFFSQVEGRPIPTRLNIPDYVRDLREVLKLRLLTGMRLDEIMLVDEMFLEEQREIAAIIDQYQIYCDSFEQFLFMDHTTSMMLLRESENQSKIAYQKYEQFRKFSMEYGTIKSSVNALEEKWRNCKTYQKFLYQISPLSWRKRYDYIHRMETSNESIAMRERSSLFRVATENLSLDHLIAMFLDDVNTQEEPQLYFTDPKQLMKVFSFLSLQNLNCLLHTEELAVPIDSTNEMMQTARQKFETEILQLQDQIASLADGIIWEEDRASQLESLAMKLCYGPFYKLISDEEALNLYVFVEDVYEMHIAPNDSNLTAYDMMMALEGKYEQVLVLLDTLPQLAVHKAEVECYAEEAKMWKEAREAARKVLQINTLTLNLKRVLEPTTICKYQRLRYRTAPVDPVIPPPPPPRPLTIDESDYLTYFTEFCRYTDHVEDYNIDLNKPAERDVNQLINQFFEEVSEEEVEEEDSGSEELTVTQIATPKTATTRD